jgi:hypothetical protein
MPQGSHSLYVQTLCFMLRDSLILPCRAYHYSWNSRPDTLEKLRIKVIVRMKMGDVERDTMHDELAGSGDGETTRVGQ